MKSTAKKIGLLAVVTFLLILIVVGGFLAAMRFHFHPSAPRPSFPLAANPLDAQRQDVAYFRQLIALDRSFAPDARTEANRLLDTLETLDTVLDPPHFRVSLMRIVALADNGHSKVENQHGAVPLELPIRVAAFSDGVFVMRATDANADLLGGRVTAIGGQSIDSVMTKLGQLRGGTPQWRRLNASKYLVLQDILYGVDVAADTQQSNWTVETPAGATVTRQLEAYAPPAEDRAVFVDRWLSSEPLTDMEGPWQPVEPDHSLPISLANFDNAFRSLRLPNTCIEFVQLKSNLDQGTQSIKDFLSNTERRIRLTQPCSVILDLRYDDGGDYVNTFHFAHELPSLIPRSGKIVVLTGPVTFSAGISTAAFVKHAGQGRVVILGEAVGDRLQFFSEGGEACLPNYPLCVAYQTGKHDYQHACTDWKVCFWLNYFFPLRVESLDPDEVISLSFKDWRAGVDPVLDRAIALAATNTRG
jgi:hypothetical protein